MTFLRVTLPLAMPGVLAAVLIVFIPTVGDYVTPRLVGGSGGTMIANMIYAQIFDLQRPADGGDAGGAGDADRGHDAAVGDQRGCGSGSGWPTVRAAGCKVPAWRLPPRWPRSSLIRALFLHAPGLVGPRGPSSACFWCATLASVAILMRVPKGRWGI